MSLAALAMTYGPQILGGAIDTYTASQASRDQRAGLQTAINQLTPGVEKMGQQSDMFYNQMQQYMPGGAMGKAIRGDQISALAGQTVGLSPAQRRAVSSEIYSKVNQGMPSVYNQLAGTAQNFGSMGANMQQQQFAGQQILAELSGAQRAINPSTTALKGLSQTYTNLISQGGGQTKFQEGDYVDRALQGPKFDEEGNKTLSYFLNEARDKAMNRGTARGALLGLGSQYALNALGNKVDGTNTNMKLLPALASTALMGLAGRYGMFGGTKYNPKEAIRKYEDYKQQLEFDQLHEDTFNQFPDEVKEQFNKKAGGGEILKGPHHAAGGIDMGSYEAQGGEYLLQDGNGSQFVTNATSTNLHKDKLNKVKANLERGESIAENRGMLDAVNSDNNEVSMMDMVFGSKHSTYENDKDYMNQQMRKMQSGSMSGNIISASTSQLPYSNMKKPGDLKSTKDSSDKTSTQPYEKTMANTIITGAPRDIYNIEDNMDLDDETGESFFYDSNLDIYNDAKPTKAQQGLYANIHAKRKRIAEGSGEKMRKPGSKGAPTDANFKRAAKTAKKQGGTRDLNKIVKELKKASKMHLGQSKKIKKHINAMNKMAHGGTVFVKDKDMDKYVANYKPRSQGGGMIKRLPSGSMMSRLKG